MEVSKPLIYRRRKSQQLLQQVKVEYTRNQGQKSQLALQAVWKKLALGTLTCATREGQGNLACGASYSFLNQAPLDRRNMFKSYTSKTLTYVSFIISKASRAIYEKPNFSILLFTIFTIILKAQTSQNFNLHKCLRLFVCFKMPKH